jgi:3-oxoisoapionate kinase
MTLPDGLLIGYYGDDFTGSTDVMEALTRAGLRTVLFLSPPTPEQLAQYEGLRAVGIAGISRSLPTEEMEAELRPAFTALRDLDVPIVHYKICSTFDSSPQIGSIGRAIEIGQEVCNSAFVPVVVGAPFLNRWVVFGNLFARSGPESPVYRLDRHPTMSRHPVTPMHESDLRLVLGEQMTRGEIHLCDATMLEKRELFPLRKGDVVIYDTLTEDHLCWIGQYLYLESHMLKPLFSASSSGLEYALTAGWRKAGLLPSPPRFSPRPVERFAGVCGSLSPVAAGQIEAADAHIVHLTPNPDRECPLGTPEELIALVENAMIEANGRSVIFVSSRGGDDEVLLQNRTHPRFGTLDYRRGIGQGLGQILRTVLETTDIRRVVVAGGDTSGYVAHELGLTALEMVCPMAPGSPLCQATAPGKIYDGVEIVCKGGQVGRVEFYTDVLAGGTSAN